MQRIIPFFLLFLLSACATKSQLHAPAKTNDLLQVTMGGIAPFGHNIPFNLEALQARLPGYTIYPVSKNAVDVESIQVRQGQTILLTLYPGQALRYVRMIEINNDSIVKDPRLRHNIPYIKLLIHNQSSCLAGVGVMAQRVVCQVPTNPAFVYVFKGTQQVLSGKMPPQSILDSWTVSQVYWFPDRIR